MKRAGALLFGCLLSCLLLGQAQAAVEAGRNPSKECALCHFRWIGDFSGTEQKDLLVPLSEEKVVASEPMCFSCHDGSVGDSRYRVWHTTMHKTGEAPSAKVSIPTGFPLDAKGRMQCATCHSAHGVDAKKDMASTIFLREPNVNSSMCQRCHQGKDKGQSHGQHPLNVKLDRAPQALLAAGGKLGTNGEVICESCHTPHGSTGERMLVISNNVQQVARASLCEACHSVRPLIGGEEARRRHAHPVDMALPAAVQLPERWQNGSKPILGEGRTVVCITCHAPHSGVPGKHLLVDGRQRDEFCLTCHTGQETVRGTAHDIARWFPETKNAKGVMARDSGTCGACHHMHEGAGPKMWARNVDSDAVDALCLSCHRADGLAGKHTTGRFSHPVGSIPREATDPALPLYGTDGRRADKGRVGCASCHDVHRWSPNSDERGGKGVEGTGSTSFLRQPLDKDNRLCLSCHASKKAVAGSKHDLSLTASHARNAAGMVAAESGPCGTCHAVHNARAEKLWNRSLGKGGDRIEQLCTECHARGGLAEGKQTGEISHPLGEASRARPGSELLPLHAADGSRSSTGGVSCATCHDVHRWQPGAEQAVADPKQEGTGLNSFLRLPYDSQATLCGECHQDNRAVQGSEHDLGVSVPQEKNLDGKTVAEGGVCSACHVVHNAWGKTLWSRMQGRGTTLNERQCRSCHDEGKLAGDKRVRGTNHPLDVRPSLAPARIVVNPLGMGTGEADKLTALPLFNADGERGSGGAVVCSTCHNPHRWQAEGGAVGKAEGDGNTSFLRIANGSDSALCRRCHGDKDTVLGTEHDLRVVAPEERNAQGHSLYDYGVCSACHVPHASEDVTPEVLWARMLGSGSDFLPEQRCLSCHEEGAVARQKVVAYFSHPRDAQTMPPPDSHHEGRVPLYDTAGQLVPFGAIACPTCHDPHQWRPGVPARGDNVNREGNSRSSFLRFKSSDTVCRNCHGFDGLTRFKMFHAPADHKGGPRAKK